RIRSVTEPETSLARSGLTADTLRRFQPTCYLRAAGRDGPRSVRVSSNCDKHEALCLRCFYVKTSQVELPMGIEWTDSLDAIDWNELSELYRVAPLGDKPPAGLKIAFGNSVFRCFAFDQARLVGAGRALADGIDCSYICDVAVLPSHQGTGLGK